MLITHLLYIGMVPSAFCLLTNLQNIYLTYASTNPGLICAPSCTSTVSTNYVPSTNCPSNQDNGLCGIIAATNVQSQAGYSQWSCTTLGVVSTAACIAPVWPGITCTGSNVNALNLNNIALTGKINN